MSKQDVLYALLRSDFQVFIRKVFETLMPGATFNDNWHIGATANHLGQVISGNLLRAMITMPPRSLKSLCASVALPAFAIGHNPSLKVICVSYSQDLPGLFSRQFRQVVESEWYRKSFPAMVVSKATEGLIETSAGGGRFATSIGGALTGFGGNLIIVDDPLNGTDAYSEVARAKVKDFYANTLISRLDDPTRGAIVIVMQRLHEDDLVGHLLEKEPGNWSELRLSAIAQTDEKIAIGNGKMHTRMQGQLLHPARLSQAILDERRRSLGSVGFSAQYQQSPVPADGALLKREWIKSYSAPPDRSQGVIRQSWDTAMKNEVSADYSVCSTWMECDNNHYLIDVLREKLDFPQLVKRAIEQYEKHRPERVLIEDKASGISLIQELHAKSGIPIIPFKPEQDKVVRFQAATAHFEAGRVFVPQDAPWLADLLKELLGFPSAKHKDQADSVSQYLGWIAKRNAQAQFNVDWLRDEEGPKPGDIAKWLSGRTPRRPPD